MDPLDAPTLDPDRTNPQSFGGLIPESLYGSFGKYRILEKIGQGGMGAVYRAQDPVLERQVAIKVPLLDASDRAATLGRFSREAIAAAALRHPSICPIFEFSEFNGIPFIVTPFLIGKSLHDLIEADKFWPVERSLRLGIALANALDYAHRNQVIHRDIKPQNILIENDGTPIILDFGLAKVSNGLQMQWTQSGEIVGTPAYMTPEQIDPKFGPIGPACDIYSLGMSLYRMLTGRVAFSGDAQFMIPQLLMDPPLLPSRVMPERSELLHVDVLLMKALEKKPSQRPKSMAEFALAMQLSLDSLQRSNASGFMPLPELRILGTGQLYRPSALQQSIRIGRQRTQTDNPNAMANDLVIRAEGNQDRSLRISRQHLEIVKSQQGLGVIDRSQAGISINGRAANKGQVQPIQWGDIISVAGVIELEVLKPASPSSKSSAIALKKPAGFEATMGDMFQDEHP